MFTALRNPLIAVSGSAIFAGARSKAFCSAAQPECKCQVKKAVARPKKSPLTDLKGKVVLITGATAGIGAACAWRFAEEGSKLVLVGRRADRLNALKNEIVATFPETNVHVVSMSVTDYEAVARLPNELPADFKDVDILVNNAGLARGVTSVENNQMVDAVEVMETNVLGTVAFCSAFLPGMKERGRGHIVNMGSVAVSKLSQLFLF
jgi:NADP-dependent 3-hydroxy acid dehydrogenase YdfG